MARWAYVTSAEAYRTAFGKLLRDPERGHMSFTEEEGRAFNDARELQRTMSYGTNTSGGYLVPSMLDPAIYPDELGCELVRSRSWRPRRRSRPTRTPVSPAMV